MVCLPAINSRRRNAPAVKSFFALLLFLCAGLRAADAPPPQTARRTQPEGTPLYWLRLKAKGRRRSWGSRKTGTVEFFHNGLAAADGSDLVVTDKSGRLPHRVLQAGPGTFLRVAFAYTDASRLRIGFGGQNRQPAISHNRSSTLPTRPAASTWNPEAGLLLTTWPLPPGANANSWPKMQKTVAAAKKLGMYGSGFVARVYHGYHHFSPAEKFVSVYRGWLGCPKTGEYIFATSSDDASFLLIDNKLVVAWPGSHGAVWDARHNKRILLNRGVHRFSYYHLNFGGPTITCAAWKPPGEKKIQPISTGSFAPVVRFRACDFASTGSRTKNGRPLLVRMENLGEAWTSNIQLLRIGFSCTAEPAAGIPQWDLGDGCSASGNRVEHVYLTPGVRVVKCTVGKRVAGNSIFIHPDYARKISRRVDKPAPYIRIIRKYPFDRLTVRDLYQAIKVLAAAPGEDAAFALACRSMLARKTADARTFYLVTKLFCERLRSRMRQPEEAIRLYRAAINRKDMGRTRRAHLIREVGDTFFYFLKDNRNALNEYDKVVGRYADVLEANIVRVTKIKIGDIFRQSGNGAKARKLYREAEKMKLFTRNFAQNTVRKGALYKTVDDYLRRNQTAAALKWLEILEWEYPMEKLDGYSSIARARIAEKEKNNSEAIKQLLWFVRASPRNSYAAEAFYHIARLYGQSGHRDEVRKIAKKLEKDYAESPYAAKVRKLMK